MVDQRVDIAGYLRGDIDVLGKVRPYLNVRGTLLLEHLVDGTVDTTQLVGADVPGWIKITDILPGSIGDTISGKVYQDAPNNTVLQEAVSSSHSMYVLVRSSYPLVTVNGVAAILTQSADFGHYQGQVLVTLTPGPSPVFTLVARTTTPDDLSGPEDHIRITVSSAPQLLTLAFTGGYPGAQTELKAGDAFQLTGTLDKAADAIDIQDFGALSANLVLITSGTTFTVSGVVANRGTTTQALAARVRARDAVTGAYGSTRDTNTGGGTVDGVNLVNLNNTYPSVTFGSVTYPAIQGALKDSEQATVAIALSNYTSFSYSSPTAELDVISGGATSIVVSRASGSYNVATPNLRAEAVRAANDAHTVSQLVVKIANVAASLTVTTPASRLRSGGNDSTSVQSHTITITSDQDLLNAPSVSAPSGTFIGGGFTGGPTVWTRSLQVHDNDSKGTFSWQSVLATNLAGITTGSITAGATYVLGGFVARTVTWDAFQTVSRSVHVAIADFSKVQAGLFSATNQQSIRWPIGTVPPKQDGFTASAVGATPHTVTWLDTTAASSNTGEAYLFNYQETV